MTLDTTFDDRRSGSEAEMLTFAIERARAQFAWKVGGLDAAGLGRSHPPSTMTLGGLIKHVTGCENRSTARHLTGEPVGEYDPEWEWRSAAEDPPGELYARWRDAVDRSRAATPAMPICSAKPSTASSEKTRHSHDF